MKYLILLLLSFSVYASNCPDLYPNGKVIVIKNTVELCNTEFVTVYDPVLKGNIFSSEKFVGGTDKIVRTNHFQHDARLDKNSRAELRDYSNSGFDKGHMAPAADMVTDKEMDESFLLSNMTPQSSKLNEQKWRLMEAYVRSKAANNTYIITGAYYSVKLKTIGDNHVPIPSGYYKCAFYPTKEIECFYADNLDEADVVKKQLADIVKSISYKIGE
jgi:endonuclease G